MPSLQGCGCEAYNKISQLFDRLASMADFGKENDTFHLQEGAKCIESNGAYSG